jgi:uncharacterized membrane protein YbhN (UPF0104 family)
MVPREHERLLGLAARIAERATGRRVRVAGQVLLLAGLAFVLLRLRSIWHDSHVDLDRVGWGWIAGAVAATACGVVCTGFVWLVILRALGAHARPRWAAIYFQAQLSKYIPGTVWQYASRAAIARAQGVPLRPLAASVPIELAATALAAGVVSLLLFGGWGLLGAAVLVALATLARRQSIRSRRGFRGLVAASRAVPLYACIWVVVGIGFWLTARGLVEARAHDISFYVGAFALAWLVGLVVVYAPAGLGVREAVLVALLRGRLGSADAVVLAAAFRGVLTLVDIGAALLGFLLGRGRGPLKYDRGPSELTRAGP